MTDFVDWPYTWLYSVEHANNMIKHTSSLSSSSSSSFIYNIVIDNDSEVLFTSFFLNTKKGFCYSGTISSVPWRNHWRGKKNSRYVYKTIIQFLNSDKSVTHVSALVDNY